MSDSAIKGQLRKVVPWLWLAMSLAWAVVIVVTDELAWPLALWIATTVGPLLYLNNPESNRAQNRGRKGNRK